MLLASGMLAVAAAGVARASDFVIDDFESGSSPAPWGFTVGPEFPGASGSLTIGSGHAGRGARLVYDFTGGGGYVGASLALASPLSATALALWLRAPPGIEVRVRVTDDSAQTLQYALARPIEAFEAGSWYRFTLELAPTADHWGGANDGVVHGPLHGIAVLATRADPPELPELRTGAMDFDEVVATELAPHQIDPRSSPQYSPPANAGDLSSGLGAHSHSYWPDTRELDYAAKAGITWIRIDLPWEHVESCYDGATFLPGRYQFVASPSLVDTLEARGLKAHFMLTGSHWYYTGGGPPTAPDDVAAFGQYAKAVAARFVGRSVQYEIGNEPDTTWFWPPCPDARSYAAMAAEGVARVHEGDPRAKVTTAGLCVGCTTGCSVCPSLPGCGKEGLFAVFLREVLSAGGGAGADAIGLHPYLAFTDGKRRPPEDMVDSLVLTRFIVDRAFGVGKAPPIWDTEWGYWPKDLDDATEQRHAVMVARELLSTWACGLPFRVYYQLRDHSPDGDAAASGLLRENVNAATGVYDEKPAGLALRTLTGVARGRALSGFVSQPPFFHGLRLQGTQDVVLVFWTGRKGRTIEVRVPEPAAAVSFLGAPLALDSVQGGRRVLLEEDDGPVYLTFSTAPASDGGPVDGAFDSGGLSDAGIDLDDGGPPSSPPGKACGCGEPGGSSSLAAMMVAVLLAASRHASKRKRGAADPSVTGA